MFLSELFEADPNQQISLYNPNSKTYRHQPMPSTNRDDIFAKGKIEPLDDTHYDIASINDVEVKDPYETSQLKNAVAQQLSILSSRQQQVIKMRLWKEMTLEEVATALGVTRERIRQIEAKALRLLRNAEGRSDGKGVLRSFYSEGTTVSKTEVIRNPEVEEGNTVCIKDPSKAHSLRYGKLLRYGRSGLAMIKLNNGENISVPPSWVFADEQSAWPAPKWTKKPMQASITEGDVGDIIIKNKRGRAVGEIYNDSRLNTGSWCWHHYGYDLGYQGATSLEDAIDALWEDEVDWVNERSNYKKKPVPFVRPSIE